MLKVVLRLTRLSFLKSRVFNFQHLNPVFMKLIGKKYQNQVMSLVICTAAVIGAVFLPLVVSAGTPDFTYFEDVIATLKTWVNQFIALAISIGLVVFLWGVVKYISAGGNDEKRKAGASFMVFGVIALFVMVGVWGIVNILAYTLGVGLGGALPGPRLAPLTDAECTLIGKSPGCS
ncbi:MAG: hypothetical protein UX94_C0005G0021 [Parcubacteria group bacterium GW2011_GWA2_47_21]|nr:MAG: hypothetical protein UX94_C0005G0021 [Parcubacteria group bacterium GW2011_GWA2_47_21]